MKRLGDFIHQGRLRKKMTMSKLAGETGLTVMYISELENHKKFPLRGSALERIAACLELDPETLFEASGYSQLEAQVKGGKSKQVQAKLALARRLLTTKVNENQLEQVAKILIGPEEEL